MSVETKRIYKIDKDDFYGITQGTRPIVDNEGNVTGHVQNPVATIGYGDRLLVVEPYQIEFIEDQESDVAQQGGVTMDNNEALYKLVTKQGNTYLMKESEGIENVTIPESSGSEKFVKVLDVDGDEVFYLKVSEVIEIRFLI